MLNNVKGYKAMKKGLNTHKPSEVGKTSNVATAKSSTVTNHTGEVVGVTADANLVDPWRTTTKGDN